MGMFRYTRRLLRIARILAAEDALFILDDFGVSPTASLIAKPFIRRKKDKRKGERLTKALERLGPSFIKLGQAVSTRSDLIGDDIADDLARLRDDLPPFSSAIAKTIVEAEFCKPLSQLFSHFEETPSAAASIAQVHKAILLDGTSVAVKILRPNIEEAFASDIELFFWLADLMEDKLPAYRRLKPRQVVQTFKETVFFELDLRFEAAAADELSENLRKHAPGLRIPKVYWEHTSRRVLVTEWIDGTSFNDMPGIRASGHDLNVLLEKFAGSLFAQVFIDGFFHADLHPGNLFLDTKTGDLVAVDFGIMGRLDWESRAYIAQIVHGFLNADYRAVAELHFAAGYVPSHKNLDAFVQACHAVAQPIMGKPLNEISVATLLGQMFKIAAEFEMETQPQLLMMQKTLMVAEGMGRMLNPNVNMWELARPMIEEWAGTHFSKTAQAKLYIGKVRNQLRRLPNVLNDFEKTLKAINDPNGIKLHPDSIAELQAARRAEKRSWLMLGWVAIITLIVLSCTVWS